MMALLDGVHHDGEDDEADEDDEAQIYEEHVKMNNLSYLCVVLRHGMVLRLNHFFRRNPKRRSRSSS